ncbi:hypothetical protein B0H34DRAFT_701973 [Crassisporium funariophilum]|nr:hypothetical protein B0H34DRAFT_701973 [Crassisporium funariophilum]
MVQMVCLLTPFLTILFISARHFLSNPSNCFCLYFMVLKRSTPPLPDPYLRNPRIHRQSGIPSILRPRGSSDADSPNHLDVHKTFLDDELASSVDAANSMLLKTFDPRERASGAHRRFVSMPNPIPSEIQARIDIDGDRIARALASPPIVDFTQFTDTYRGPSNRNFEGLIAQETFKGTKNNTNTGKPRLKRNLYSSTRMVPSHKMVVSPHPAAGRKPDPRLIVSSLEVVLGPIPIGNYLDVYDLLAMHQLDQMDFEERDSARAKMASGQKMEATGVKGEKAVLGEPLRKAAIYASTTMVLGGREHELPTIVVSCVEELYRTGIYQTNLFRTLPNRTRLMELINIFDSEQQPPGSVIRSKRPSKRQSSVGAGFGANTSLHLESTPDICALLSTYLSALPETILIPALFFPIWHWCGMAENEVEATQQNPSGRRLSSIPLSRSYTNPVDMKHIVVAQLLLHLLPSPNFSLLVYLLAFFSQVAMVHEENGVGVEDLGRMFGGRIFGPQRTPSAVGAAGANEIMMDGEVMMCWFLRRWGPISDGLFDVVEDAKMGNLHERTRSRRNSSGHNHIGAPGPQLSRGLISEGSPVLGKHGHSTDTISTGKSRTPKPNYQSSDEPRPSSSNDQTNEQSCYFDAPYSSAKTGHAKDGDNVSSIVGIEDKSLQISTPSKADGDSIYSAIAIDERLLDLSMPVLMNQTIPDSVGSSYSRESRRSSAGMEDNLDNARQRISVLEAELEKSNTQILEARQELLDCRLRCLKLENLIGTRESGHLIPEDPPYTSHGADKTGLEDQLETTRRERDHAQELLREIQKLMVKN